MKNLMTTLQSNVWSDYTPIRINREVCASDFIILQSEKKWQSSGDDSLSLYLEYKLDIGDELRELLTTLVNISDDYELHMGGLMDHHLTKGKETQRYYLDSVSRSRYKSEATFQSALDRISDKYESKISEIVSHYCKRLNDVIRDFISKLGERERMAFNEVAEELCQGDDIIADMEREYEMLRELLKAKRKAISKAKNKLVLEKSGIADEQNERLESVRKQLENGEFYKTEGLIYVSR